jgi:hypothetical protein
MPIGGKNSDWRHGTHGALETLTNFTGKMRSADVTFDGEQVDATVWGDGFRAYEQSFKSAEADTTYKYDAALYNQLAAIYKDGNEVAFQFSPDGTTSGKPKVTGHMFIKTFGSPIDIGELIELGVTWQITGEVTLRKGRGRLPFRSFRNNDYGLTESIRTRKNKHFYRRVER